MKEILRERLGGLKGSMEVFWDKLGEFEQDNTDLNGFEKFISGEMKDKGYDVVSSDKAGNVIGIIKGNKDDGDIVIISHFDIPEKTGGRSGFKNGITSGLFAGTLLKNALAPLTGNIVFCCIPNINSSEARVEYLFNETLKHRKDKIKSVLLCEPTGLNVYLGHKGRMEYEIQITGDFAGQASENKMHMAFPLVNELYKVSEKLPLSTTLGKSKLSVSDVSYTKNDSGAKEIKFTVDRVFVPEEDHNAILKRAKSIAEDVYSKNEKFLVNTAVAVENVTVNSGLELKVEKKYDPWVMDVMHPFVRKSLEALNEIELKPTTGYWQNSFTFGSYTYGKLKLPTLGFGAGNEESVKGEDRAEHLKALEAAVLGTAWIAYRNIGMPSFGWTSDEI